MKKCPNIDKNSIKFLKNIGMNPTIENRKIVFLTICIFVRLIIAGLAYQYRNKKWLPYLIIILCSFVIYHLYKTLNLNYWWSKKFHILICLLLIIVSILIILKKLDSKYISYLLYIDVIGGFMHSLLIKRC